MQASRNTASPICWPTPWHRWTFRLDDGALVKPAKRDEGYSAPTYFVEIDEVTEEIYIGFREFSENLFGGDEDF